MGFVSYEFVESHEKYGAAPMHTLVVPVKGHEAGVEAWLEENIASPQVAVETFGTRYRYVQEFIQIAMLFLVITEVILATVAAIALAVLNTIFISQRQDDLGIMYAVGHSCAKLTRRTLWESISMAGAAWLNGTVCCLVLVLGTQASIYAPKGMSLDVAKIDPWLFTLPIPLAAIAASTGTSTWTLSRLDPVTIIERR
jgi:putative ABC transport system permease protein/lipoprotein-releasing system permease protein